MMRYSSRRSRTAGDSIIILSFSVLAVISCYCEAFAPVPLTIRATPQVPSCSSLCTSRIAWTGIQQQQQHSIVRTSCRAAAETGVQEADEGAAGPAADDLEGLQRLFTEHCDTAGLMTLEAVQSIPFVTDLLHYGYLLPEELDTMWRTVPKFPADKNDNSSPVQRIDVDAFVQLYRAIDDLFEEEEYDDDDTNESSSELASVFAQLLSSGDKKSSIDKDTLRAWEEIVSLVDEQELLTEQEFSTLWAQTTSDTNNGTASMDMEGFVRFNAALDDLFEQDEDDTMVATHDAKTTTTPGATKLMVEAGDLPPDALFYALTNSDGRVGRDELQQWKELQDMLKDGDLLQSELDTLYEQANSSSGKIGNVLDKEAFLQLYKAIDDLFEDAEEDDDNVDETTTEETAVAATSDADALLLLKQELMSAVEDLEGEDLLPCGLDATEPELKEVMSIVEDLEKEPHNYIRQLAVGELGVEGLGGSWELVFTSSSAMKFNKGLSGLAGSVPTAKFGGLVQKLTATKYMTDVEYTERIALNPSAASFDVTVTGAWELRKSVSLFTGEPSVVMAVEPERVSYGRSSTRADHWKSLGPMNMLDITYLDEDLRIMRGNTSVDTVFVFRRLS